MNTVKLRMQLAEDTASEYYDGDIQALLTDVKAAGGPRQFIEGGGLAIPYYKRREELQVVYGESDEEAAQYSDKQVFATYTDIFSDAIRRLNRKNGNGEL